MLIFNLQTEKGENKMKQKISILSNKFPSFLQALFLEALFFSRSAI